MISKITCNNLKKYYAGNSTLSDVSLHMQSNAITGLLGSNGAGKSTLIKSLLGLIYPDSGEIDGLIGKKTGYLPEIVSLPKSSSAWQLIQLALSLKGESGDPASLLQMVDINKAKWHQPLRTFSKGMRQRVALAYVFAGNPDWVILDEPMSGLDALGRRETLHIIKQAHQRGTGILICSHIVPDLVRICNTILVMSAGVIVKTHRVQEHSMQEASKLEDFLSRLEKDMKHA